MTRDGALSATYEYDLNGNRTRLTTPGGVITGAYDAQDRLTQYGSTAYTYGSNGELKTKTEPGVGTTSYVYDALGNLTAVTLPDATALTYVIDGQNRRIGKRVNGVLTQGFLYQGQLSPVAELDGSNQLVSRFVYGTRANVPDYLIKSGVTYRIISDHLGSVRLVVNSADGTVAQRIDYDEFGRVTQNTAPGFQPFGFAGGLLDDQTGLVRFGARDYDAGIGRWTVKDPVGFAAGQANVYAYASSDPINGLDPSRRIAPFIAKALISGVVGAVTNGLIESGRTGAKTSDIIGAAVVGFVGGAIGGLIPFPGVSGAVTSFLTDYGNDILHAPRPSGPLCKQFHLPSKKNYLSALLGGATGVVAFGINGLAEGGELVGGLLETAGSIWAGEVVPSLVEGVGTVPKGLSPFQGENW